MMVEYDARVALIVVLCDDAVRELLIGMRVEIGDSRQGIHINLMEKLETQSKVFRSIRYRNWIFKNGMHAYQRVKSGRL
jgi:hypothetical protein